jgi:RsiW-degrading membrane proteinase PrsW (M82 family)
VALGFACLENILYVSSYGIYTGIIRAVSAVPGHVCDGILMGSYLALAKHNRVRGNLEQEMKYKRMSIFIPMVAHGIYDFCLFLGSPIFMLIFVLFVIYLFVTSFQKVKEVSSNDVNIKFKNKYCPGCGNPIQSNFCQHCGRKNN